MITRSQAIELYENGNPIEIGMAADAVRRRLHPDGLVSYGAAGESIEIAFVAGESGEQALKRLDQVRATKTGDDYPAVLLPISDGTAVEYLKALALTRLYLQEIDHVQSSLKGGLKIAQIALRFGADDICYPEDGLTIPEEDIRRLIYDAGFVPKQRDALFRVLAVL